MWCIKALHPSDPLVDVDGVPDWSGMCSCMLSGQQQINLSPTYAASWDCDIYLLSDPTCPVVARHYLSSGGSTPIETCFPNPTFGTSSTAAAAAWLAAFSKWRLAYEGLSVYLNASHMYDEGTIAACQYPTEPREVPVIGSGTTPAGLTVGSTKFCYWSGNDVPAYANLMKMPNAYVGEARDGCYMPLRLDSNHAVWHDERDACVSVLGLNPLLTTPSTFGAWPYFDATPAYQYSASVVGGGTHLRPVGSFTGVISMKGLNPAAKITMCIRSGFECQCTPDSIYAPFLKLCPDADAAAVATYYAISRRLKDAYPVEYNDFGKLWDVIKSVARTVDPFLGFIPGGKLIRAAGTLVGKVVDQARKDGPVKGPADPPSAAVLKEASDRAKAQAKVKLTSKQVKAARKAVTRGRK